MSDQSNSIKQPTSHPETDVPNTTPATPVCINVGFNRSHSLSPELKTLHDQVFKALPQDPHYRPLASYCSSVREGMKLGLDVSFLNLVQKIHSLVDPLDLLKDLEEFIAQLSQLEQMGYNVTKLWDRFDVLRRTAERVKASRDKVVVLEVEIKDKGVKVEMSESRISDLKTELKKLKDGLKAQKSEVEDLQSKMTKLKEDATKNLGEFATVVRAAW